LFERVFLGRDAVNRLISPVSLSRT